MKQITLHGANSGILKLSVTKLLQERLEYSLSRAKSVTDAILKGQEVTLPCDDAEAELLAEDLRILGARVSIGLWLT